MVPGSLEVLGGRSPMLGGPVTLVDLFPELGGLFMELRGPAQRCGRVFMSNAEAVPELERRHGRILAQVPRRCPFAAR
jgi:hypothetical protein